MPDRQNAQNTHDIEKEKKHVVVRTRRRRPQLNTDDLDRLLDGWCVFPRSRPADLAGGNVTAEAGIPRGPQRDPPVGG